MPPLTPGAPLPIGAPIYVTAGDYEGYVGTITGTQETDNRLTHYRARIKLPEQVEGMEFEAVVEAAYVQFSGQTGR
jgi:hypothetical protein